MKGCLPPTWTPIPSWLTKWYKNTFPGAKHTHAYTHHKTAHICGSTYIYKHAYTHLCVCVCMATPTGFLTYTY